MIMTTRIIIIIIIIIITIRIISSEACTFEVFSVLKQRPSRHSFLEPISGWQGFRLRV